MRLRGLGVGPLGLLYEKPEALELAPCLGVAWVHPWEALLTAEEVARLRARYRVLAWTVNERARAQALAAWGVEALVTDRAEALV